MRVRGPSSVVTVEAADDWTVAQLVTLIQEKTGVDSFTLKAGFPPAALDLSDAETKTLGPLKLNGDTVMVIPADGALAGALSSGAEQAPAPPPAPAPKPFKPKRVDVDETVVPWEEGGGYLGLSFFASFTDYYAVQNTLVSIKRLTRTVQSCASCLTTTAACSRPLAALWASQTQPLKCGPRWRRTFCVTPKSTAKLSSKTRSLPSMRNVSRTRSDGAARSSCNV